MITTTRNGKHVVLLRRGDEDPLFTGRSHGECVRWAVDKSVATAAAADSDADPGPEVDPGLEVDAELLATPPKKTKSKKPRTVVKLGDLVQWTSSGIDMLAKPEELVRIEKGFGFIESSETGMPIGELEKVNPTEGDSE